jgi:hypothetical protein
VDIVGLSDAALPGDQGMRNASRKISHEAGSIRRNAGKHLSYYFLEQTIQVGAESIRSVCVPKILQITTYIHNALTNWLRTKPSNGNQIRLKDGALDVIVTWNAEQQSTYNFQSSMPPEIRSLRNNYIFNKLKSKGDQLTNPYFRGLKCAILTDVGSTALRYIDRLDPTRRVFNGSQIIEEYLRDSNAKLDVVSVITPKRSRRRMDRLDETVEWEQTLFCRPGLANAIDVSGFEAMQSLLPKPRLEGYQVRQLHEKQIFSPSGMGNYMGTNITWTKGEKSEVKFSARALLDLLGDRCSADQFLRRVGLADHNIFKGHLDRGETISAISLKSGGPDEDDDQIVVEFRDDAGARKLRVPAACTKDPQSDQ